MIYKTILFIVGFTGILFAMNENASYFNFVGVVLFGLACFFFALKKAEEKHKKKRKINLWGK